MEVPSGEVPANEPSRVDSYKLNDEPNAYGCYDPQCLDSTWDHDCPVTPGLKQWWWTDDHC